MKLHGLSGTICIILDGYGLNVLNGIHLELDAKDVLMRDLFGFADMMEQKALVILLGQRNGKRGCYAEANRNN